MLNRPTASDFDKVLLDVLSSVVARHRTRHSNVAGRSTRVLSLFAYSTYGN